MIPASSAARRVNGEAARFHLVRWFIIRETFAYLRSESAVAAGE
jgi:hypothetical protein